MNINKELKSIKEATDLPLFRQLIHRARTRQHGSLTWNQYMKLSSAFIAVQPPREAGLLIGWGAFHIRRLRLAISQEGVSVRPEPGWTPKPIPGNATGFSRLGEVEQHMKKRAARRRKDVQRMADNAAEDRKRASPRNAGNRND